MLCNFGERSGQLEASCYLKIIVDSAQAENHHLKVYELTAN